jgi:ABC-type transporter lipoprotein component MlaA
MCVPNRYDLANWSCVNSEVKTFYRNLEKIVKIFEHVLVVKIDLTREHFTRHGLHMNTLGKEMITNK